MTDKETIGQPKTLAEKLALAIRDIGPISKSGHNKNQDYDFQQDSDIKAAVARVEAKYGFTIVPASVEYLDHWQETTKYGGTSNFHLVKIHFSIRDGKEEIKGEMLGEGSDSGDKAISKAETSAQKNFYKQLFNISDKEEDPDATDSAPDGGYVASTAAPTPQPARKAYKKATPKQSKPAQQAQPAVTGLTDSQLCDYKAKYANREYLLVTLVKHMQEGSKEAQAVLHSLKGMDRIAAGEIYNKQLYLTE